MEDNKTNFETLAEMTIRSASATGSLFCNSYINSKLIRMRVSVFSSSSMPSTSKYGIEVLMNGEKVGEYFPDGRLVDVPASPLLRRKAENFVKLVNKPHSGYAVLWKTTLTGKLSEIAINYTRIFHEACDVNLN